jgi:hypothetical protein
MTDPIDPHAQDPQLPPVWQPPHDSGWPAAGQPPSPHAPPAPYVPPPYGAPPLYAPPPFGAQVPPGYPPQTGHPAWPGYQAWPSAPAPSRRRGIILIVLLCVAAIVGAGVLTYFALRKSSPARVALPESVDGYGLLHTAQTQQLESMMRGMLSASGSAGSFHSAAVGAYGKDLGDLPQLIVLALPTDALPTGGQADDFTNGVMVSVVDPMSFPAGAHGGNVRCGTSQFGVQRGAVCAWSDSKTTGLIASSTSVSPTALARIENDFRDRID